MEVKKMIVRAWLLLTGLWLSTVLSVSAMNAVVWLSSIGFQMPLDVQAAIRAYYAPIFFLLWLIFAVRLFYNIGVGNWKSGKFHPAMISYPLHGILFTIVSSMLSDTANMSWQTFLTVVGIVAGVTILYSCVASKCFR
jgi:hypothetical protein